MSLYKNDNEKEKSYLNKKKDKVTIVLSFPMRLVVCLGVAPWMFMVQLMHAANGIQINMFEQARLAEKIKMLESHLSDILVKNTTIYGILSKAIHELSEEECRKYFPVVKERIYQILGMCERLRKRQANEVAQNKALNARTTSIQ